MSWLDLALLAVLAAWLILALRHEFRMRRKGGCEYCAAAGTCPLRRAVRQKGSR